MFLQESRNTCNAKNSTAFAVRSPDVASVSRNLLDPQKNRNSVFFASAILINKTLRVIPAEQIHRKTTNSSTDRGEISDHVAAEARPDRLRSEWIPGSLDCRAGIFEG